MKNPCRKTDLGSVLPQSTGSGPHRCGTFGNEVSTKRHYDEGPQEVGERCCSTQEVSGSHSQQFQGHGRRISFQASPCISWGFLLLGALLMTYGILCRLWVPGANRAVKNTGGVGPQWYDLRGCPNGNTYSCGTEFVDRSLGPDIALTFRFTRLLSRRAPRTPESTMKLPPTLNDGCATVLSGFRTRDLPNGNPARNTTDSYGGMASCPNGRPVSSQPYWVFARTRQYDGSLSSIVSLVYRDYGSGNGGSWMEPWYSSCLTGRCHLLCSVAQYVLKNSKQQRHGSQPFGVVPVRSPGVTTGTRRHLRQVLIFNVGSGMLLWATGVEAPRRLEKVAPVATL